MNAERWKQIERLFHAAAGLDVDRQKAFLEQAVRGDDELRANVETLLKQNASTTGLRGGSLRALAETVAVGSSSTLRPGTRFGPYKIEAILGVGGMGEVYRGSDTRLNRTVAIKVVLGQRSADEKVRERFYREARAAFALNHPNICSVYDIGECDGQPYLVLEYLEGETLRAILDRERMKLDQLLALAIQIADALHAAHSRGVLHRDIKAANVFVTRQGVVKVLDFGIAKLLDPAIEEGVLEAVALTDPGAAFGTVAYMSPEQARGENLDARSDLFSFGVLLYEMVTGQLPFNGSTTAIVFDAILNREPIPIRSLRPDAPRALEVVISSALEKKRDSRVQSAADLKNALSLVNQNPKSGSGLINIRPPVVRYTARVCRDRIALLLTCLAIVIGLGVLLYWELALPSATVRSVAVLPIADLAPTAKQSYIAEGMTEGLISELSKINALKVVKIAREPLEKVAQKLNCDRLIDGSVTTTGERIRLVIRVVEVRQNRTWTQEYERYRLELPTLQSTIARDVLKIVGIPLTEQEKSQLSASRLVNVEAYEAYLRGRQLWNRQTAKDLKNALEEFRDSIASAPDYAPSYAGLADCYSMLGWFGVVRPLDVLDAARAAAKRATQLDSNLAEAHISLGLVTGFADWDWPVAEKEFKAAVSLNPSLADCHHWYGHMLEAVGRAEEGLAELQRAHDLDALYPLIEEDIANAYLNKGDTQRGYGEVMRLMALQPKFWRVHHLLGRCYKQKRMFPEAIAAFENAVTLSGGNSISSASIGQLYALSGRKRDARRILEGLLDRSKQSYVDPETIAELYAGLGERDRAFEYLEKARSDHSLRFAWIVRREPALDMLRSDPRFAQLLKGMRLSS